VGISHLKPEGNRIVADQLFDILEHKGGIPAGAPDIISSVRGK
jgi:hypothetical protein